MHFKKGFFDRFSQTIDILKMHWKYLLPPFFILYFTASVFLQLFGMAGSKYLGPFWAYIIDSIELANSTSSFSFFVEKITTDITHNVESILLGTSFILIFLIIQILISLYIFILIIRITKNTTDGNSVQFSEIIKYGNQNIQPMFGVFIYKFLRVQLIPLIGIFSSIGIGIFTLVHIESASSVRWDIVGIHDALGANIFTILVSFGCLLLFVLLGWYLSIRYMFVEYHALNDEQFTKTQYQDAKYIAQGNFWRIFGNTLLLGLIAGGISSFVGRNISGVSSAFGEHISNLISLITSTLMESIISAFSLIFIYILYRRIKQEKIDT